MNDNNLMSQDEINALLSGINTDDGGSSEDTGKGESLLLNDMEKDALGEVGNISMGTAATTLFTLLGQKVNITTPKVEITTLSKLGDKYPVPFVAVDVKYKVGLEGSNILVLRARDVKIIASLMMGGDGHDIDEESPVSEIDLSAISEAMNQMVGSGATSLSEMFGKTIDIDPPRAFQINLDDESLGDLFETAEDQLVKVSFRMVVGDLIDSEIMQLLPIEFAREIVSRLLGSATGEAEAPVEETPVQAEPEIPAPEPVVEQAKPEPRQAPAPEPVQKTVEKREPRRYNEEIERPSRREPVTVKTLDFEEFEPEEEYVYHESIDLVNEIPVEVSVELGRTMRTIGEILDYGPGTIIELEKLLGEPLDIYANGKMIAKGEVVVIEDNFGVRVTEIVHPSKRIKNR
ncbi:flagellar motor switch protein FliN [Andreesenia angusta]|uniref:Flagellar motor switch protein FliN n=1 Tax=Andreesenia angusta TaxID=39480 RepID=A0A1S1VAI8_9FIRM|nr:flagellar motor switch phosphatase FliY [Andreesenia angusta]OHW62769.1 flagellar motor switch protein FliN [Andreesenia angusta]